MRAVVALLFAFAVASSEAQQPGADQLERCARIASPEARLACYDRLMPEQQSPQTGGATLATEPEDETSLIGDRWGLGTSRRDARFDLRPHKASYLLFARYSDAPNTLPTSPTKDPLTQPLAIDPTEAKFQVSFKVKLADFDEMPFGLPPAALWGGYTQQSQWQVYNKGVSRPFRETNYEPEVMFAFFPDRNVFGWRWRLASLSLNHQSNGRSDPLSRSWNRVALQLGFEQDNFAVLVRPWLRLRENYSSDDNPDITKYLGYGDITVLYTYGRNTFSLVTRYNPSTGRGALQAAWNFPLQRRVRGFIQWFSGYGESLIDYNWRQNTIGIGISLADVL